jgi:hypothetical protein
MTPKFIFLSISLAVASGISMYSCSPIEISRSTENQTHESVWEKRFWLEKASRTVLYGGALSEEVQSELIATKSKEEIVDFLLSDSRFYDTVLDFNNYFLNLPRQQNLWVHSGVGSLPN